MQKAYYIPDGPKNLAQLFPSLSFSDISEYYVEMKDSAGTVVASTVVNKVYTCGQDVARLHFLNYLGAIDCLNFEIIGTDHDPKSDSYEVPVKAPLVKSEHALQRFNVRSNDIITGRSISIPEENLTWVDELFDSPLVWMEWEGTQGQADSYLPVVILDRKTPKRKEEDRYIYEVIIEFKFSHEKQTLRT